MLRATGFFRGIDCPFYSQRNDEERGCDRPYCHFRHSRASGRTSSGLYELRKAQEEPAESNDQEYDPCSPEVVRVGGQYDEETSAGPAQVPGAMELELVNRAIEVMQSELEKDKKKLSQFGKQGYEPSRRISKASYGRQTAPAHSAYDPESYQMAEPAVYNPTPRSTKYTLDLESARNANSMEYVPTTVSKPVLKKAPPALRSGVARVSSAAPPCSSSSKSKYTLDNVKPANDMEYDPLLNFSAKLTKGVKDSSVEADGRKRAHHTVWEQQDTEYVPTVKKTKRLPTVEDSRKYSAIGFESDEDSSGVEYHPSPVSRLQEQRRSSSTELGDENKRRSKGEMKIVKTKQASPVHVIHDDDDDDDEYESDNFEPLESDHTDEEPVNKKIKLSSQIKTNQIEKVKKDCKALTKKPSSHKEKKGSDSIEKNVKNPSVGGEKKNKSHGKPSGEKVRVKEGDFKLKGDKDGKAKKTDKDKVEHSWKDKKRDDVKKPKTDKLIPSIMGTVKCKEPKNGKLQSSGREKPKNKSSGKEKGKSSSSGLEKKKPGKETKPKPRSLSHADLFGDESPEENDEDERIVRKSASAFKRGGLLINKRKASDDTESSSEDDNACELENVNDDEEEDNSIGLSTLQGDLDFDCDPMEECLRIFNESKYVKTEDKGRQAKQPIKEKEDEQDAQSTLTTLFPGQKKRVSHVKDKGSSETSQKAAPKPQRSLTAQEICYQRMQIAQQQAAQLAAAVKRTTPAPSPFSSSGISGEKRRVMHKPNPALISATSVLSEKQQQMPAGVLSPSRGAPGQSSVKSFTSAAMLPKTTSTSSQKRVAHTPSLKSSSMKRPVIPTEFGSKVPTIVRQRYLNIFIDECLKSCRSEEEAFQLALEEEKLVYDRSNTKNIYLNVAVNTLKKLRSRSQTSAAPATPTAPLSIKKSSSSANRKALSHQDVLGGRLAATTSYTINRTGKQQELELKGAVLYHKLKAYVLSEEQLQEHSYPRPHPERLGHAVVYNVPEKKNLDPFSKVCCRCGADYKVNASGSCVRKEECHHHWGRLRRYKVSGGWETQYSCCSGAVGSPGCQTSKQHVQDGRKESLDGYVKTFSKKLPADGNGGVYALDCEMCYTKQGLELTRVTVIDSSLKVVYDTFVKPESKVVDYNTRFSGVTQEDLENATMRLRDVQAVLLSMFSAESILIGHSLESDLFALKLLHSMVVDTAVVFPHRLGLPYKRALRNLMADYLKRIIQDNVDGHDSSEDAAACMELMMWRLKEDTKVKR